MAIADEVMTGFGRTGRMFACEHEGIHPDIYVFAKGLSGGYLPLALTLVAHDICSPFLAPGREATLFYGHSYTGNALGCAAALTSLEIFRAEQTIESLTPKIAQLGEGLASIGASTDAKVRSIGMIGAIELQSSQFAAEVCDRAHEHGVLTRPIRNVVVLMPPLPIQSAQLEKALLILKEATGTVLTAKHRLSPATGVLN